MKLFTKKHLSIKYFAFIMLSFLFVSELLLFYNFYVQTKKNISTLIENNLKSQVANLNHYINSNISEHNVLHLSSHLDNTIHFNTLFNNLIILSDTNEVLYNVQRNKKFHLNEQQCQSIFNFNTQDIFTNTCYTFPIKVFHNLDTHFYKGIVYINKDYLNTIFNNNIEKFIVLFAIFIAFFSFTLWSLIKIIIVHPLEDLRDYAYKTTKIPHRFFITELEMIRNSLKKTFHRLDIEQKKLYHLSTRDVLSGLYNRQSLLEKLESLIYDSQRNKTKFALLFIDLDNFKNVNDSLGHDVGDKLLILLAKNLLDTVRKNDIVSRLGGDEFIIVLPNIEDETKVMEVVERIQNIFKQTIEINFSKIAITASIGITIYPNDATNTTELLKNADIAMYKAKAMGKNHYYFFTQELNSYVQEKLQIQKYIQDALTYDYFQLYYQPKVDIQSGKIVACEALIRLIHPEVGLIPPDKFIKIAEHNGFIVPLGRSILQKAIAQLHHWENTPLKNLKVSINISALELEDREFLENLRTMIQTIQTSRLDIEITESVFISGYQEKIKIIHEIKKLGLTLSLDDFGTGYSSLSYLKELPFDTLKIDKAFVDDINTKDGETFIKMIVNIAKTLNLEVVAEGVEKEEQKEFLKSIACDQYQGYLCSKPLKADEFEKLFIRCNQEH